MDTFVVQKHFMNSTSTVKVFNNEEDAVNYIRHKKANHTSMPVPEDVKDMDNLVGAVSFYNNNDEPVVYTITHMNHAQPSRRSSVNASSYVPYVRADNKVPGTPVIDGIYIEKERDRGYHCRVAKGVETGPEADRGGKFAVCPPQLERIRRELTDKEELTHGRRVRYPNAM
jgi:hypothetical protein